MDLTAYPPLLMHLTNEAISRLSRLDRYTAFVAKCVITSCLLKQLIQKLVLSSVGRVRVQLELYILDSTRLELAELV
jgi:hypothetical protein